MGVGSDGKRYYARDVTPKERRTTDGSSDVAQAAMARNRADPLVSPKNRKLICLAKSPIVLKVDDTGSMGRLPRIAWDKWPMVVGQLAIKGYVEDPQICIAAIGDITWDTYPIQVTDFVVLQNTDEWLERICLEGGGGGEYSESYEVMAYFFARYLEMPNAETPICIITGDEDYRKKLFASDLKSIFGGEHQDVDSITIFEELKKKFKGNVFLIHRRYGSGTLDSEIVNDWERALGENKIIKLGNDLAIADVVLGIVALIGGRTLDEYVQDMIEREQDKTPGRIEDVRKSLEPLEASLKISTKKKAQKAEIPDNKKEKEKPDKESSPVKKKRGRIF